MILTIVELSYRSAGPSSRNSQMNLPTNAVVLKTNRLILRPLRRDDIPQLLPLIGARGVAATTLRIPHPYTEEDALKFLEYSDSVWEKEEGARFGIFLREGERLWRHWSCCSPRP